MLMELLRKDLRICRLPIVTGIASLIGSFVLAILIASSASAAPLWSEASATAWALALKHGSTFSAILCQATLAMIGGTIIATERADRSAEFLAYLPPSRWQLLRSKMVVFLGAFGIIWGICIVADLLSRWLDSDVAAAVTSVPLTAIAPIGIVSSGIGWCASAKFDNTGPAVGLAFAAPLAMIGAIQGARWLFNWPISSVPDIFSISCTTLGIAAFLLGSIYYVRRVEP
jgi:hypothetical protein